ncbi:MAG: transcription elongation factor GreA [Patescibacteria group bacterium]|nr:transcription elongation factor GreA [Patescibacteria group bacterium]
MNPIQTTVFTKEGLQKLQNELEELKNVKLTAAVGRVAKAREMGDLSENAEYSAARDELSFIEGRIAELEELLITAKVANNSGKKNSVALGCKVTVHIDGKKDTYTVVGEWEANPLEKKISHESPLGKALLGKKVGDKVEVDAPAGKIVYKIIGIE